MNRHELERFLEESLRIEGIRRPPTDFEIEATEKFLKHDHLGVVGLCELVGWYAPHARLRSHGGLNVRVGNHVPPPGGPAIRVALEVLLARINRLELDAYQAHIEYETLHPFTDGNGRSGRAIWLWQMREAPLYFLHHWYYQSLQAARP